LDGFFFGLGFEFDELGLELDDFFLAGCLEEL
jgi:hypothetical protein